MDRKDRTGLPAHLPARLDAALETRTQLLADPHTTACRVFNSAADGIDGLVIEKFGHVLVVQLHEGRLTQDERTMRQLCARAVRRLNTKAAYCKVFPKERSSALARLEQRHHDPAPWIGSPVEPEFAVLENGMRLLVRPYDGYSTGVFLEHRLNRQRVRGLARGRRVLNAFAYTCGFAVAAGLGGAATTVNVDISRKLLDWGRRNLRVNRLPVDNHAFLCVDIFDYCRRARRQDRTFDLVILDPPTFARSKRPKRVFALSQDLDRLVTECAALLEPDGLLLLSTNHRGTSRRRLEGAAASAAAHLGRRFELVARPRLPADFRSDPGYARSILVRLH